MEGPAVSLPVLTQSLKLKAVGHPSFVTQRAIPASPQKPSLFLSNVQSLHDVRIRRIKLERFLKFLFALVEISVAAQS